MSRAVRLLLGVALVVWACSGCRGGCDSSAVIAELTAAEGQVARDLAASVGQWTGAKAGAEFVVGDGLKTGAASKAGLELAAGGKVEVESETIIRFRDGIPGASAPGLAVELGNAAVFAGNEAVRVATDVGQAIVEKGGALRVTAHEGAVRFAVAVGRVRFEPEDGTPRVLEKGEAIEVGIGTAVLDPTLDARRDAAADAAPEEPPVDGDIAASVDGSGASVKGPQTKDWKQLQPGPAVLETGSVMKLARGTRVAVSRGGQSATLVGAGEFLLGAHPGQLVEVRAGSAALTGANRAVRITAPGGAIVAEAGAVAEIGVSRSTTRVSVAARTVEIHARDEKFTVGAGQSATLAAEGTLEVQGRSLDYADILLGAGQSAILHDPHPPTAVGLATSSACPAGALVTLFRGKREAARARAQAQPSVLVPSGAYTYRIRCVEEGVLADADAATGRLTVVADSGTSAIPRSAPATRVDVDGRTYTVLYQNRLPQISVVWSRPPSAPGYTLSLSSGGATRTIDVGSPSYTFKSGALAEGRHRMRFVTAAGAKSKTTTLDIRFDNAAPKATLRTPPDGSFAPGAQVRVSGMALPGWKVSVAGKALPVDGQYRFSANVSAPTQQRALAVTFSHPSRGTHYYLRRSNAGSTR